MSRKIIFENIILNKEESILNNIILYDIIDKNILNKLLISNLLKESFSSPLISYNNELQQLNNLKKNLDKDGKIAHKYKKADFGYGRLNTTNSISFISLRKEIRHTLSKNKYVDIDIVNAQPTILYQILLYHNLKCDNLKKYIEERDYYLNKLIEKFNITRDNAKKLFVRIMYYGKIENWVKDNNINIDEFAKNEELFQYLTNLSKELEDAGKYISDNNPKMVNDWKKKEKKNNNIFKLGSFMSFYLQEYEERVLQNIYLYLSDNNYIKDNICSLCHDGIMILLENYNEQILENLNLYILENTGFDLKFVKKELDMDYLNILDNSLLENCIKYEDLKYEFEKNNFKLNDPLCYCEIDEDKKIIRRSKDKFRERYYEIKYTQIINNNGGLEKKECRFIDKWLDDIEKKVYNKIYFFPSLSNDIMPYNPSHYNTFTGYKIENIQNKEVYSYEDEDFNYILEHLRDLTNNNEEHYNYFLNYLSHIIQKPYEQPKISIIFQTKPGVGKDKFFNWFGYELLGSRYFLNTDNIESLFGHFTSSLEEKILVIMTEIESSDTFKANKKIKNFIDGARLRIEKKGHDEYYIDNFGCLIGFGNLDNPVKLEKDERRFVIFSSSTKWILANSEDKNKHFKKLIDILQSGKYNYTFYKYLKERNISELNLLDRPISETYIKNAAYQSSIIGDFFVDFIYSTNAMDVDKTFYEIIQYNVSNLFDFFQNWKNKNGYSKYEYSVKKFSLEILNDYNDCIEKKRKNDGQYFVINRELIIKNLIKNNYLENDTKNENNNMFTKK